MLLKYVIKSDVMNICVKFCVRIERTEKYNYSDITSIPNPSHRHRFLVPLPSLLQLL